MADARADESADNPLSDYIFDQSTIVHRTPGHPTRDDLVVMSTDFHADPFERMAWMREHAPAYWDDETGLWAITRHADIQRVEADHVTFCSVKGSRPESSVPSMINTDPPDHTRRRRLVSSGFTPKRVAAHEDFLRATVTDLIDGVIDDGGCDFVTDIATPIPLRMIATLMGLPLADEAKLLHWSDLFATGGVDEEFRDQVVGAVMEWVEYIVTEMGTRTDSEAEDLISLLMYPDAEIRDEPISAEDLIYETMLILVGGDETTRHVMSGGLEALLLHPEQLEALRADRSLLPGAIEEMLRWVTPVRNMSRTATVDVEVGGQPILAGDRTLLLYLSGNRDEAEFGPNAHEFDITRSPNKHQAFGANGRHFCLGASLARLELTVLFEEVLDRLPEIRLVGPHAKRPERTGNFVLGLERLPVEW
jgi:cytochrome P450 family 142 subfamily A polypeptide 1